MDAHILNVAAYRFVTVNEPAVLQHTLLTAANAVGLKGTILLATEGINLFLAGTTAVVEGFITAHLETDPRLKGLDFKRSYSIEVPFKRMKVRVRPEIVTFAQLGQPRVNPALTPAPAVSAQQLKEWIDSGKELVILDTRNTFEFERGAFDGSEHLGNDNFRQFAQAIEKAPVEWHNKTVVTFCTGGIRCEKAAPFLIERGFKDVYQLQGGILRYFELVGKAHYTGDCFVFDERRALNDELATSDAEGPTMGPLTPASPAPAPGHVEKGKPLHFTR